MIINQKYIRDTVKRFVRYQKLAAWYKGVPGPKQPLEQLKRELESNLGRKMTPKQHIRQSLAMLQAVKAQRNEEQIFWDDNGKEVFTKAIQALFEKHNGNREKVKQELKQDFAGLIKEYNLQNVVNQVYAKQRGKY